MDLPLFPLHTVLFPGVALPLHVFEDRYRAMVERCLAERSPFGVVLIREGREVGPGDLAVAGVGTVAEIREATRRPDGRFDLLAVGTQRFRLDSVEWDAEPYLVGRVTPLGEVLGEPARAKALGEHVVGLFIRYLGLVNVDPNAPGAAAGLPMPAVGSMGPPAGAVSSGGGPNATGVAAPSGGGPMRDEPETFDADADADVTRADADVTRADADADVTRADARDEALDDVARRLAIPDDPTVLSHLLSGIVQIESIRRQTLLEMPTTELRLAELARLLDREISLLERGLGTYSADPRTSALRRN